MGNVLFVVSLSKTVTNSSLSEKLRGSEIKNLSVALNLFTYGLFLSVNTAPEKLEMTAFSLGDRVSSIGEYLCKNPMPRLGSSPDKLVDDVIEFTNEFDGSAEASVEALAEV